MTLTKEERTALVELIGYMYAGEERDYVQTYGVKSEGEDHIFTYIRVLSDALAREVRRERENLERDWLAGKNGCSDIGISGFPKKEPWNR